MPTYEVTVADRNTGAERVLKISAKSASEARSQASTDPTVVVGKVREKFDDSLDDDLDRSINGRMTTRATATADADELLSTLQDLVVIQSNALNEMRQARQASGAEAYARIEKLLGKVYTLLLWVLLIIPIIGGALIVISAMLGG